MTKGFVYTLEAVIASSLILTMIIFVLPGLGPETSPDFLSVESGLDTLEQKDRLETDLTPEYLEDEIEEFVPTGFNHSSVIYSSENNFSSVDLDDEIYLEGSGGDADIQFWTENADDLEAEFEGEVILDESDEKYYEVHLRSTEGWLNMTGSGSVNISFNTYEREGSIPESDEIFSRNIFSYYEGDREVQIHLWR